MRKESGEDVMIDAMLGLGSGAVERQEARGQEVLAASAQLPRDMREGRAMFEALGFVFSEPADGDLLFLDAEMPDGWEIRPTDHSVWSDLLDGEGRKRASVFYKAAFYDRRAHMQLETMFRVSLIKTDVVSVVDADGAELFEVAEGWLEGRETCLAWLDEHYPDHRSPLAYWDVAS